MIDKRIFVAIIIIGIIGRLFVAVVLPDEALNDSLFHLTIVKNLVATGYFPIVEYPNLLPLWYYTLASFYVLSGLELTVGNAVIFPIIFTSMQMFISYLLLKELFPKKWYAGLAFIGIQPLLAIYGGVNYIETFASIFILFSVYLLIKLVRTEQLKYLIALPVSIAAMALTKLNATLLVPAFFVAGFYWLYKKQKLPQLAYFAIFTILLSSAFFGYVFLTTGSVFAEEATSIAAAPVSLASKFSIVDLWWLPYNFNLAFWYFPTADIWESIGMSADLMGAGFTLVSIPIMSIILWGFYTGIKERNKFFYFLTLIFLIALIPLAVRHGRGVYIRMLVPVIPLLGIVFNYAWLKLGEIK